LKAAAAAATCTAKNTQNDLGAGTTQSRSDHQ
jgi:hypothetical protein